MNRMFGPVLVLLTASLAGAAPVDLRLLQLRPDVDAYRYAKEHGWRVYFAADDQVLADAQAAAEDAVIASRQIYSGDDANIRWISYRRGESPAISGRVLFQYPGMVLVEAGPWELPAAGDEAGYRYRPAQPLAAKAETTIINPALQRDTSIATLVNLVDSARVRNRLLRLQGFGTRYYRATNHHALVDTLRATFGGFGIGDVRSDTFATSASYHGHNVTATLPGRIDNAVTYIVGGHFDSYAGGTYLTHAPGADDNGTGTVAALEMARVLASHQTAFTVKAIAFDAEEIGLYGSDSFAHRAKKAGADIRCMLNYDMVGALDSAGKRNDSIFVSKVHSGMAVYAQLLGKMAGWYGRLADTNLVASYNSIYLNGSDSWSFYNEGWPVTYSEEYVFTDKYHTGRDSVRYLNIRYCTSIIRAGMGLLATLANFPLKVRNTAVVTAAKGQLALRWSANTQSNVTGYRVYWGRKTQTYTGDLLTASRLDTTCTIGGLITDSTYYAAVAAVDDSGKQSVLLGEISAVAAGAQGVAFDNIAAQPGERGIVVSWRTCSENDCFRWDVERAPDGTEQYALIGQLPGHGTTSQPQTYRFSDDAAQAGMPYRYRLAEIDANGRRTYHGPVTARWSDGQAAALDLGPARPNPAATMAEVSYTIPVAGAASLAVYDILGRQVRALVSGQVPAGTFVARWDGTDRTGRPVASGVYYYRLHSRGQSRIRRLVLVR